LYFEQLSSGAGSPQQQVKINPDGFRCDQPLGTHIDLQRVAAGADLGDPVSPVDLEGPLGNALVQKLGMPVSLGKVDREGMPPLIDDNVRRLDNRLSYRGPAAPANKTRRACSTGSARAAHPPSGLKKRIGPALLKPADHREAVVLRGHLPRS
jgi:hypothetical protein